MARHRQRVCLQDGLHLRIHKLIRQRLLTPPVDTGPFVIRWANSYTGEPVARGSIEAKFESDSRGLVTIRIGGLNQRLRLDSCPRPFGGRQWYFRCPITYDRVAVLWLPPGTQGFASRQRWGRQVAYASQFATPSSRAITGAQKIRLALGGPDWISIDEEFPPKPARMRWRTYKRLAARCLGYEDTANEQLWRHMERWLRAV